MIPEEQLPGQSFVVPPTWRRKSASVEAAAIAASSARCVGRSACALLATSGIDATESEILSFYDAGESAVVVESRPL